MVETSNAAGYLQGANSVAMDIYNRNLPLAPSSTDSPIGSLERIRVMTWRAENGFSVMHPGDNNEISGGDSTALVKEKHGKLKERYPYCANPDCRCKYAMTVRVDGKKTYLCGYCLRLYGVSVVWSDRGGDIG